MVGAGHPTAILPLGEALAAVGHGDDVSFRQRSASALDAVGPDTVANIEHQDAALGKIEGLRVAADTLHRARAIGARA